MCPSRIGMCVDGIAISASVYFKVLLLVTSTKSTPLSCILYLLLQIHLLLLLQNFVNASGRSFKLSINHLDWQPSWSFQSLHIHDDQRPCCAFLPKMGNAARPPLASNTDNAHVPAMSDVKYFSQLVCSTDCTAASRNLNNAVSPSQWSHCSTITKS